MCGNADAGEHTRGTNVVGGTKDVSFRVNKMPPKICQTHGMGVVWVWVLCLGEEWSLVSLTLRGPNPNPNVEGLGCGNLGL